jgi:hypothetical protein
MFRLVGVLGLLAPLSFLDTLPDMRDSAGFYNSLRPLVGGYLPFCLYLIFTGGWHFFSPRKELFAWFRNGRPTASQNSTSGIVETTALKVKVRALLCRILGIYLIAHGTYMVLLIAEGDITMKWEDALWEFGLGILIGIYLLISGGWQLFPPKEGVLAIRRSSHRKEARQRHSVARASSSPIAVAARAAKTGGLRLRHLLISLFANIVVCGVYVTILALCFGSEEAVLSSPVGVFFYVMLFVIFFIGISVMAILAIRLSMTQWGVYSRFAHALGWNFDKAQMGAGMYSAATHIEAAYDPSLMLTRAVNANIRTLQDARINTGVFGRNEYRQKYAPFSDFPFGLGGTDYVCAVISSVYDNRDFNAFTYGTRVSGKRGAYFFFGIVAVVVTPQDSIDCSGFPEGDDVRCEGGFLYQIRQGMLDVEDIEPSLSILVAALA